MGDILTARRSVNQRRLQEFKKELDRASEIVSGKACVYLTGSFGRGEAGRYSDLDLFIVGGISEPGEAAVKVTARQGLRSLDEICLKAELIDATKSLKFPEFSGDGEFLKYYTIDDLVKATGKPEDDANNTFTARLLLLLESRPLLGDDVYGEAIDEAISKYWGDYEGHKNEFVPAFLANDILRLWRTFCVNYEARTSKEPEERHNKRRLKNYKLKYSRMLTCYSALIYLLAIFDKAGTVSPEEARNMVRISPTKRLEWLISEPTFNQSHQKAAELLRLYEEFLESVDETESVLLSRFSDKSARRQYSKNANVFGDTMFELLDLLGHKSRLHRLLVV